VSNVITLTQLVVAVSIPTVVALIGILLNQSAYYKLGDRLDRMSENMNNQITTLLTTMHGVDVRVVRMEERNK
jgi:hypothetical protein